MSTLRLRLIRGIGANILAQGVNTAIQLVGLPVYLAVWGSEKYGEWLILSSLAGFLSMSDIGFASAGGNEMAMSAGSGNQHGALRVYQSMWTLLCGLGCLMLAVILPVLWFTPAVTWLPLCLTDATTGAIVLSYQAIFILVGQQVAVVQAGFRCEGNYAVGQALGSGARLFEFITQISVAIVMKSMPAVALSALIVRCLSLVLYLVVLRRYSPWLVLGVRFARRATIKELFPSALAFMGMPLGNAISIQGTVQVVAAFLGPAAVVLFTAHRTVANIAHQAVTAINHAIWPEFSTAYGAGDIRLARDMHRKACRAVGWLTTVICTALLLIGPYLFSLWTRGKVPFHFVLFLVLQIMVFVKAMWLTSSIVPIAINQHKSIAIYYVISTGLSLAISSVLAGPLGLPGVAVGLVLADLIMGHIVLRKALLILSDNFPGFFGYITSRPNSWRDFQTLASATCSGIRKIK